MVQDGPLHEHLEHVKISRRSPEMKDEESVITPPAISEDQTPRHEKVDMRAIDPARQQQLVEAARAVSRRIVSANKSPRNVRLVLVSKLKPATDILALHKHPPPRVDRGAKTAAGASTQNPEFVHFGENYLQELQQKARSLPTSIRWHFIGGLQTNKCKTLASEVPGLWCVSSVDSAKKADGLEKGRMVLETRIKEETNHKQGHNASNGDTLPRLRIHVQANTSNEESKSGVQPGKETLELCRHVVERCPHLRLAGLMTVGAIARSQAEITPGNENEDFVRLTEVRDETCEELSWRHEKLELSMGMSNDFESAIRCGSDEVRVGSTIFGERAAKGSRLPNDESKK